MAASDSEWLSQWIKQNKLQAYESKFEEAGLESQHDFQGLGSEEKVIKFIRSEEEFEDGGLGEKRMLKVKRILKAIQAAQASLSAVALVFKQKDMKFAQIVSVRQDKDIKKAYESNAGVVDKTQGRFYDIDVEEVMHRLATCGELIELALYKSNGCKCNPAVMTLMSKYHTLVKNSFMGSAKFVECGVTALEYHELAYKVLTKSPAMSIKFVSRCAELAAAMTKVAQELVEEATVLRDDAEKALELASVDKDDNHDQRRALKKVMAEAKSRRDALQVQTQEQADQIKLLQKREQKAIEKADKARSEKLTMSIIKCVTGALANAAGAMNPASNISKTAAAAMVANDVANGAQGAQEEADEKEPSLDALAMQINQQLYEAEKEQIQQNAELRKKITELENMNDEDKTIEQAFVAIEMTIGVLAKIKVVFANVAKYWQGVEAQCMNLAGVGGTIEAFSNAPHTYQQVILELIEQSALSWFTLLKVNYYGKNAIAAVDKKMDGILNNLKSENEAVLVVGDLAKMLKADLHAEDVQFAKSIAAKEELLKNVE